MALTFEERQGLRREISRRRKKQLRKDSKLAELQLKQLTGEPMSREEQAVILVCEGNSIHRTARRVGFGHDKVHRLCRSYGVVSQLKGHPRKYSDGVRSRAFELREQGESWGSIARELGLPSSGAAQKIVVSVSRERGA